MSNCKKSPYFEGLTDETIKQGSDFDPTEGVKAYDGYDEEIEYTYSPQELDTCLVGSQVIQYRASQTSEGDMLPNICIPDGLALALPSICDDYESTTAERIIRIIKANDPTIYGIPQVTVARDTVFNVLDGVTAVDDNGNPITDIEYSGYLDKRVSGNPITITDGQSVIPVKSLEVELEPIQDLNGYDKPWAGGAGKNKLQVTATSKTLGGITFTVNSDGSIKADGTASGWGGVYKNAGRASLKANTQYTLYAEGGISSTYYLDLLNGTTKLASTEYGSRVTFTPTEDVEATLDVCVYYNKTVNAQTMYPMLCLASETDASFAPYENTCPIDGHTEVNTQRTGKNLFDKDSGRYIYVNGKIKSGDTIYAMQTTNMGWGVYIAYTDGTQTDLTLQPNSKRSITITKAVDRIAISQTAYDALIAQNANLMISLSDFTDYKPYNGTTYTTDLGQTVYGGTLDVVSGELVIDRAMVTYDGSSDEAWSRWATGSASAFAMQIPQSNLKESTSYVSTVMSNYLEALGASATWGNYDGFVTTTANATDRIIAGIKTITEIADWKAYLAQNPLQVVYELATPQTIQLTPQQVMLLTGDNNLWSDGDVTMVYSTDIPTDGSVTYPLEGEYEITYSAEDKCGNVGTATRTIIVTAPTANNSLSQNAEDNTESEVTE